LQAIAALGRGRGERAESGEDGGGGSGSEKQVAHQKLQRIVSRRTPLRRGRSCYLSTLMPDRFDAPANLLRHPIKPFISAGV
jgi:hypothetical protein